MKYHEMVEVLAGYGFWLYRQAAGTHEIWHHDCGARLTISRSGLVGANRKHWMGDVRRAVRTNR